MPTEHPDFVGVKASALQRRISELEAALQRALATAAAERRRAELAEQSAKAAVARAYAAFAAAGARR